MSPAPLGRKTNVDDLQALKAATRRLVDACGGQESAASITRVSHQTISRYRLADRAEDFIPADVLLDLEADAGDPIVTRQLAARQGWTIVRAHAQATGATLVQSIGQITQETSDVVIAVTGGLADGDFDARDIDLTIPEIDQAIERLAGLKQALLIMRSGAEPERKL
ncbi:hypothetical protein OSH11_11830 [Kaistia dalseonensis]|uniref:Uncharacterized protein n=1 Tax=Kaistia dalseonensis TaxID=410840 RepID=A0ABU0H6S0_9HYPH|nr:hypothetical protein [Kaistia dalseonensis]MCX5495398.1 hypothetical protein [Kaistia dalseonensis]MDQ0437986.1 hypothetical protein [Kaistia dalseonensis]